MRQLFLPACICLVTWSGATSSDTGLTLDEFTSRRHISSEQAPVQLASLDVGVLPGDNGAPRTPPGEIGITHKEDASAVVAIPREDSPPVRCAHSHCPSESLCKAGDPPCRPSLFE